MKENLTTKERAFLESVPDDFWAPAGWIATKAWGVKQGPWGKRSGAWQSAGRILHRLYEKGHVRHRRTDTNQSQWRKL